MTVIDSAVEANAVRAKTYDKSLGQPPAPKLVIVTCMDPRLTGILQMLGLGTGDADVIRNAGSVINEDSIRSLLVSTRVLGTKEIMIINHTDCGMQTFTDRDLEQKLENITGESPVAPARFYSFRDLAANTREQIRRVKSHPWIPKDIPVRGFVYDVSTGSLREVTATAATVAA